MVNIVRSKIAAISLVFTFIIFVSPNLLRGEETNTGNLIGFVYAEDGIAPLENAVVKIRNISTGKVYESSKSDKQGVFRFKKVEEGLYIVGITAPNGNYNLDNLIGIKANKTAKVALALKPSALMTAQYTKEEECPRGKWYIPEVEGKCDSGYKWNPDKKRCECVKKKEGIYAFFLSNAGKAAIIAASVAIVYTFVRLTEKEAEVSPYK